MIGALLSSTWGRADPEIPAWPVSGPRGSAAIERRKK
jgi:hypothetical protein